MTIHLLIRSVLPASAALLTLTLTGLASAQLGSTPVDAAVMPQSDASRDEVQLRAEVRDAVERDTDVANTALVFNNLSNETAHVYCTAIDGNGNRLSRRVARIPANGVRYLRASDLADGRDFVGSAVCTSRNRIAASAIFLAPGAITNLEVLQSDPWHATRIRFPLIASY